MTSGSQRPAPDHGTRPGDDVWTRMMSGWHATFWVVVAAALARVATVEASGGRRATEGLAVAALAAAYAGFRPSAEGEVARRDVAYLVSLVVLTGVACAADPALSLLLFVAFPHVWMFSGPLRSGLGFSAALAASATVGFVVHDGASADTVRGVAPPMVVGLLFSLLFGTWVSRIIDQSRERAELITELETARALLATAHHAQGVTAERERMAREIHDTLAQGFTSVVMLSQAAAARLPGDVEGAAGRLAAIEDVARENLAEARALVAAFAPADLDGRTLTDAVRRLASRFGSETGVAVDVEVDGELTGLSRDGEVVLLRAVQEALTNVRRHARARLVTVRLAAADGRARVEVADDGVGFEPATADGFGLAGMRGRVHESGGSVDVVSSPGRGTRVRVALPLPAAT